MDVSTKTAGVIIRKYEIKALGKTVRESREWLSKKLQTIESLVRLKFEQNDSLRDRLISTGNASLYEATFDTFFGCGLPLSRRSDIPTQSTGKNKLG